MGVKERKERQKIEMKDLILQSAHQLFLEKGFEEVSIRNIAEAIEYSPATIYLYFKDKDEIFYALHGEAFKIFNTFVSPVVTIKDPIERLFALGDKYIEFAFLYRNYYDIMFIMISPMECDKNSEGWIEGETALNFLESIVQECISIGHFKGQNPRILSFTIWSFMHGTCALALRNRMKHYPEDERDGLRVQAYEAFKLMLKRI